MVIIAPDRHRYSRSHDAILRRGKRSPHDDGRHTHVYIPVYYSFVGLCSGESITEPMAITFAFAWIAIAMYCSGAYRSLKRLH